MKACTTFRAFLPGSKIDHIVHLILENRSFDAVFGWLYAGESKPGFEGLGVGTASKKDPTDERFLITESYSCLLDGKVVHPRTVDPNLPIRQLKGKEFLTYAHWPLVDPGEEHEHCVRQMTNADASPHINWAVPSFLMNGFATDYKEVLRKYGVNVDHPEAKDKKGNPQPLASDIMTALPRQMLPAMTSLARQYAISDDWHASVPSQTWCNRLFAISAASGNIVNNEPMKETCKILDSYKDTLHSIFHKMDVAHKATDKPAPFGKSDDWSWRIYTHSERKDMVSILFRGLLDDAHTKKENLYINIDQLKSHAKNGTLASYSLVEPLFMPYLHEGKVVLHNDQHPSEYTDWGESWLERPPIWEADKLVLRLFHELFGDHAVNRDSTLLIVTYDEHGGNYDHVSPPIAHPPQEGTAPIPSSDFAFDRLGVRIPALFISPSIVPGTILKAPTPDTHFDHTSVIASIRERWPAPGLKPLSGRDAAAPTFWHLFNPETPAPAASPASTSTTTSSTSDGASAASAGTTATAPEAYASEREMPEDAHARIHQLHIDLDDIHEQYQPNWTEPKHKGAIATGLATRMAVALNYWTPSFIEDLVVPHADLKSTYSPIK